MIRLSIFVLIGLVFTAGNVREAVASPQILAAVPAGGPMSLVCDGTVCEAEFSAICLQPERPLPVSGTAYTMRAQDLKSFTLTGHTADGQTIALPSSLLKTASQRGQTAVRFFIDRDVLEQNGLQFVALDFKRMIALVPKPAGDDPAPQTAADISRAVAGIKRSGKIWAELNDASMTVARIAVRVSNGLPKAGPVSKADSDRLLKRAVNRETAISPRALESTRQLMALCQRRSGHTPIRTCLGEFHDQIMRSLNGRYWSTVHPAS